MRLAVSIDKYLEWFQLEEDATKTTLASYGWLLDKLAEAHPEARLADFEGRAGTEKLRDFLGRWARLSSSTRANRISILHSFFDWAEREDLIEANPARRIRRPPKRKANIYRPTSAELTLLRRAATLSERPAVLLMEGVGMRLSEVLSTRWEAIDLLAGEIRMLRKGRHWHLLPLAPDVLDELRDCYRQLAPEPDDHVFVAEIHRFDRPSHLVVSHKNAKMEASAQALQRMLRRVCLRAGVRPLTPHQLRHGFAKRFLQESRRDTRALQGLLSHAKLETTEGYLDDVRLEDMREALEAAHKWRQTGQRDELAAVREAQSERCAWEESNPRSASDAEGASGALDSEAPSEPRIDGEGGSQSA